MNNRTAVITGSGQGIGRAAALKLAALGYHVHLLGRTPEKLAQVAEEIHRQGGSAATHTLDVSDSAQVRALSDSFGQSALDVLINNAGEALIKPLEDTTDAEWDLLHSVNLKAPFLMCRALSPHLRRSDNATVINIGSKTALAGFGGVAAYTAAKTGLLGLTRSLAAEWKDTTVRVVMLAPGPADTPMRWSATPDIDPAALVSPDTIAETIAWLVALPPGVVAGEVLVQTRSYL